MNVRNGSGTGPVRLPYVFARQSGVLIVQRDGEVHCLFRPSANLLALAEARRWVGGPLAYEAVSEDDFERSLGESYRDNAVEASDAAGSNDDLETLAESAAQVDDLLDQSDDAPVIRLINAVLLEAIREDASDIHIEPLERRLSVRFRVDGVLREVLQPRRALAPMLISRIKVMAKLDIAERRLPQDGRVSLRVGGHEVDGRVSTIPSQYGERAVLRLLDRGATRLGLGHLGMSTPDADRFRNVLARPDGLLLVTGPTGSGKTTTLYAALDHLNDRTRNVLTVEDPIEYSLDGVGQMQVNPRTELTFARGLRAILRQDPDVIMVGEIRDRETAQVAVEAAMTGHFVLSTLHTNTALGAVARLIEMGVEPFLLAPVLRATAAQRLVRRLCMICHETKPATEADTKLVPGLLLGEPIGHPVGCSDCSGLGYRGRSAVYELVTVTPDLERMIQGGFSEAEMAAVVEGQGPNLLQDGLRLLRTGVTSVAEISRIARGE